MEIDTAHFTPGRALAGGALIGAAAAVLVLGNGRVAGVSGILGGALRRLPDDLGWRLSFLAGLVVAALATGLGPAAAGGSGLGSVIVAGLLVGFGARLGGGCTSGHGVCGLGRGSTRSLAATVTFMAAGFATVFVLRHGVAP